RIELANEETGLEVGHARGDDVAPVEAPVPGVVVRIEQLVDDLGAFVGTGVFEKSDDVGGRGQLASDVEPDAAKKLFIGGARGGRDLRFGQLGVDEAVQLARLEP